MLSIEKPLVVGRKAIMDFLQITNWDSVQRMIKKDHLPVGKAGGRWCARRTNLIAWLDQRSNNSILKEDDQQRAINVLERVENLLSDITSRQRSNRRARWQSARKRRQLFNMI